ncbi:MULTISPECIES: glutathione S-transferase family protein [unclassified Ensifer]|uniref:glutathione S-transferase family protein n=1 Tax=unclassified Ensifer TaxID=2633371 RepID=UPI0008135EDB|nr:MULTISPECIES: glutathione S-transferase family protein [unclassified Ensifer]OCP07506.1 glutathione S-transferase [Ensifer sp. LC11]OCP07612.1 glutathione S-transferase [Ensifer sp. LC14]OCP08280.1 glutathione S-transferase [Ensifer sp. LC13]OCP32001.1 glutathione S-transferase [Ensifer sp. LC499]
MILIGQYDSPFVRRVGIALTLYGIAFEHRPWSSFGNADEIRAYNPLTRVPTLVLDDGLALTDSHIILDYLDSLVSDEQVMFPRSEPERHRALRIATLATGLGDKAVSLFYENRLHGEVSVLWVDRCRRQIEETLGVLEASRSQGASKYWFGDRIGHADIAVAVVLRFLHDVHASLVTIANYPHLQAHAETLEALPVFQTISQPFIPPA